MSHIRLAHALFVQVDFKVDHWSQNFSPIPAAWIVTVRPLLQKYPAVDVSQVTCISLEVVGAKGGEGYLISRHFSMADERYLFGYGSGVSDDF